MTIKPSLDRRIQTLFPVALACLLVLGTARLVLDSLKSNQSSIFRVYGRQEGGEYKKPVFVLPEDRFEKGCDVFEGQWSGTMYPALFIQKKAALTWLNRPPAREMVGLILSTKIGGGSLMHANCRDLIH